MTNFLKVLYGEIDQIAISIARDAKKGALKEFFETHEEWFRLTENQFGNGFEASRIGSGA